MQISKYGLILNVKHYRQCVEFYRDILGLDVLIEKQSEDETLTCFAFGDAYLMVEPGGEADLAGKPPERCPVKLRFNTEDVECAAERLRKSGVDVRLNRFAWGVTAEFYDPDGNRCALRSDAGFAE